MSEVQSKRKAFIEFQRRLFASRFFTTSVLLHFIFIIAFGGTKLARDMSTPQDFTGGGADNFIEEAAMMAPPAAPQQQQAPTMDATAVANTVAPSAQGASIEAITTTSLAAAPSFTIPTISTPVISPTIDMNAGSVATPDVSNLATSGASLSKEQLAGIANFTGGWSGHGGGKGGRSGGPTGIGTHVRQRLFEFTAYLAKYGDPRDPNRMGDWASTNEIKDDKIVRGSLPNLLYLMNARSRDRIRANPSAVPLDLSSDEIFKVKPPFIFFTGHRDFVLSEVEVENLRKYLTLGGCIWGDSSLPGQRSRFDIAFRREMRRIIPDVNKEWKEIPANHPLYTSATNRFYDDIKAPPSGINHYQEPAYYLEFGGEIAVLYTANDYGDMWRIALDANGKYDTAMDENLQYKNISRQIWDWKEVYYRNLSEEAIFNSYKFGTNVVLHLLTRWEQKTRTVPTGLQ